MREQNSNEHQFPVLDEQTVKVLMRQILGRQDIELLKFQVHRASDWTGPATRGVYHLTGNGQNQEREVEWSLVLKVLSLTSDGSNPASSEETHVLYWKREALVYQSHLLDDLPGGVRGPRCYGIVEHADSSVWLWLEDVKEIYGPRWPLEQYARAAHHLGQMNGAYLAGRPLPSYPWLVSSGSPRGLLDHYGWMWKIVHDPSTWQHPRLCAAFPLPIASRLLRLWEDHAALLDVLERLPQTFGHLDAWRRNLFAAPERDGHHQLIAIEQRRDMSDFGRDEIHHRRFYHLRYNGHPAVTWRHEEPDPYDGPELASIIFEFFWARLPYDVPPLIADHGIMLPELLKRLS